jgi:hypothetical protein
VKVIRLQAQGFKRLTAVDITPGDAVVTVRGNNAEGKSSLLDSIKAALGGADAAPIKPIRTGDDFAAIRVELGDGAPALIVEKYFDEVGEKLRVTNAEGAEYRKGQTTVDDLLGRMTFDPLAFARMTPKDQAVELRRLVPLSVDLDALAAADKADVAARRDVNRDAKALKARLDVIPVEADLPDDKPDLDALTATLASAAETNTSIERERDRRSREVASIQGARDEQNRQREDAAELRRRADALDAAANAAEAGLMRREVELDALPSLDELVDTTAARRAIDEARVVLDRFARKEARDRLAAEFEDLRVKSDGFTSAIGERAAQREEALKAAAMPVEGLALEPFGDDGELIVTYQGEPFAQASSAQQLRVSMQLAMTANPRLRVMLIKDGSLLDDKGLALVRELAGERDYQVWLEAVGEGDGTGVVIEAGAVKGAPEPERLDAPKRRKPKGEGEGVVTATAAKSIEPGELVVVDGEGKAAPAAPAPARRKPSDLRKPAGDLFGGGE